MASLHPQHPLTILDEASKYLCEGCMIPGGGKRHHCQKCNFNLHEYCATCPKTLSTFMHGNRLKRLLPNFMHRKHSHSVLKLVNRKLLGDDFENHHCNICRDPIEGLFYRCELCEFNVHPICTLLPETLRHALHEKHELRLLGSSEPVGACAVCTRTCNASSWRYRCETCEFDIHIECVLVPCEKRTTDRGITEYVPPSQPQYFDGYHGYGVPYWNHPQPNYASYPSPSSMQHHYMLQSQPQPNYPYYPSPSSMYHHNMSQPQPNCPCCATSSMHNHNMLQSQPQQNHPYYPTSSSMHHHNMSQSQPQPGFPYYPTSSSMYHHNVLPPQPQSSYTYYPNSPSLHTHYMPHVQPHPQQHQQPQSQPQHQHQQSQQEGGGIGSVMFDLVKAIGLGVISNVLFGAACCLI